MLPMSVRCNTCGNYMSRGTKFNTRMEDHTDKYLGTIKTFRFYSKCPNCSSEFTYLTDPRNSDYTAESGASRNFEPWREQDEIMEKQKQKRDGDERGDALKSLEIRMLDSKREMDVVATLDELISMKSRQGRVSVEAMLGVLRRTMEEKERREMQEEEERNDLVEFKEKRDKLVRRIREDDEEEEEDLGMSQKSREGSSINLLKRRRKLLCMNPRDVLTKSSDRDKAVGQGEVNGFVVVKKKSLPPTSSKEIAEKEKLDIEEEEEPASLKSSALLSLCQQYESDGD